MMMRLSFIPTTEAEKRQWLVGFKTNLPTVAQALRLDPQEVQQIDDYLRVAIEDIDLVYQREADLDAVKQTRNEHREEFMPVLAEFVRYCKADRQYSKSLGELLNIETTVTVRVPKNKTTANSNKLAVDINLGVQKVSFKFRRPVKHLVTIYCRRGGEADFSLLSVVAGNNYDDNRPNINGVAAEKREYCFTLSLNDRESERSSVYTVGVAQ